MLEILEPGFLTTVQDRGRGGFEQYGVTRGGAMDVLALRAANRLVGNGDDEAALELAAGGLRVRGSSRTLAAVTGAEYELAIDGRPVPAHTALLMRAGETLSVGARTRGGYGYLAFAGGIEVPRVLGARATDLRGGFGGFEGRALRTGDRLAVGRTPNDRALERAGRTLPAHLVEYYRAGLPIRILWGPHDEFFSEDARAAFIRSGYTVGEHSDRMGMRLAGPPIAPRAGELLSCGLVRGAVQAPPDGQPIILQADCQTTGGYPILGTVVRADQARLAQKRPGEIVRFAVVSADEARAAWDAVERLLNELL